MAKRVRVSDDDVTYYTLPGSSGEFRSDAADLKDTVFGQSFESSQPGLVDQTVTSNGIYKGFAGYNAVIKKASGTSTTMTAEAMSLVSGKTYKITDTAKNFWDNSATFVVYDNAVDHTADVVSIDFLFGQVTFASSYSPTTPITVDGKYFTAAQIAKGKSFKLTQTAQAIMDTDFETGQGNDGINTYDPGLKNVSLEVGNVFYSTNAWRDALVARTEYIIEIAPVGSPTTESVARGIFKLRQDTQQGDVGALEEESLVFNLYVPDVDLLMTPFRWEHPTTSNLNTSIQQCLDAYDDETTIYVQYLHDGTNGWQGTGVITEISLSGGIEAINEFSVSFQISDETSAVP